MIISRRLYLVIYYYFLGVDSVRARVRVREGPSGLVRTPFYVRVSVICLYEVLKIANRVREAPPAIFYSHHVCAPADIPLLSSKSPRL